MEKTIQHCRLSVVARRVWTQHFVSPPGHLEFGPVTWDFGPATWDLGSAAGGIGQICRYVKYPGFVSYISRDSGHWRFRSGHCDIEPCASWHPPILGRVSLEIESFHVWLYKWRCSAVLTDGARSHTNIFLLRLTAELNKQAYCFNLFGFKLF